MTTRSEIAYETAETSLANQRQAVTDLRGRAATLLSAASIVAAFLGAQALSASNAGTQTVPTATTVTNSATTTIPETTTAISHYTGTKMDDRSWAEKTHGTATTISHGSSTTTTHGTSTILPAAPASKGIHLNTWEWIAVGTFVGLAVLCIAILLPWKWKGWHTSATTLVSGYVDPGGTVESMQRDLAIYDEDYYRANTGKLDALYWCFRGGCALLVVQVVCWILDLARR